MFLAQRLSRRCVAGSQESLVRACRHANRNGMKALPSFRCKQLLPGNRIIVEQTLGKFRETFGLLDRGNFRADLGVSLDALGMGVGKGYCLHNLLDVTKHAGKRTVWITEPVGTEGIDIYLDALKCCKNIGITLEANRRKELLEVIGKGGRVRLVKSGGDLEEQEDYFSRTMRILFVKGNHFAISTSDEFLAEKAGLLQARYQRDMEFHFPFRRKRYLKEAAALEYNVSEVIPFGD